MYKFITTTNTEWVTRVPFETNVEVGDVVHFIDRGYADKHGIDEAECCDYSSNYGKVTNVFSYTEDDSYNLDKVKEVSKLLSNTHFSIKNIAHIFKNADESVFKAREYWFKMINEKVSKVYEVIDLASDGGTIYSYWQEQEQLAQALQDEKSEIYEEDYSDDE